MFSDTFVKSEIIHRIQGEINFAFACGSEVMCKNVKHCYYNATMRLMQIFLPE